MYCKFCGKQIDDDAKFCSGCGAATTTEPVRSVPAVEIPEKKKKRRPPGCLIWFFVIVLVFGSCSALFSDGDPEESADAPVSEIQAETEAKKETVSEETIVSVDEAAANAKSILGEQFEDCAISYDETGITADISVDGTTAICLLASTGNAEAMESWESVIDSVVSMAESMTGYFREIGFTDYVVSLNVKNDQNKDNYIIMTINGVLVYDAANSQ